MSRLLQALKNLEARPDKPAPEKRFLAHLADVPRPPSPDPPASPATDSHRLGQPTPIKAPAPDHPLAALSSGLPTINIQRPPPAIDTPSIRPTTQSPAAIAPNLAPSQTLDLVRSTPPATNPPPPPDPRLSTPLPRFPTADSRPPPPSPRLSTTTFRPPTAVGPPRLPTLLERAIHRTLAEPETSEPFRQLAERLKADLNEVAGRSILIAGIGEDSQSHSVLLNTAAVLAEAGEPILVIDGDAARRLVTSELELTAGTGLAELAEGKEPESDPICLTTLDNLSVLPMGKSRLPDPATVANRMASLVQSLEEAFRLVLIDGGRASDRAAAGLAKFCDATYFVVHMGQTEVPEAQSALRDFRAAGARLLGCIATT